LVLNSHHDLVNFILPAYPDGSTWSLLIDTNLIDREPQYRGQSNDVYGVTARSLILLARTE
jgi:glycogen operon protein